MNVFADENAANFAKVFNGLPELEYQSKWANGTGYFDGASKDESIKTAGRAVDPHGRRIVIIPLHKQGGDRFKNVVIFQRYSDSQDVLIVHCPRFGFGRTSGRLMMNETAMPLSADGAHTWADALADIAAGF